jgi:hypothetical protein
VLPLAGGGRALNAGDEMDMPDDSQQSWTGCLLVFLTMMAALLLVIMLLRGLGLTG